MRQSEAIYEEPILTGIVTDLLHYDKYSTTRLVLDDRYLAFVKELIDRLLIGSRLSLTGEWKNSRRYGQYFSAHTYRLIDRDQKKKRNIPYLTRLFGHKEYPDKCIQSAERLEPILRPLLDMKKKNLARKIAMLVKPQHALDVRDNPYLLYFRKIIDFNMAEILSLREFNIKPVGDLDHPDRIRAAVREVLNEAYESGSSCLDLAELQKAVRDKIDIDLDLTSIDDLTKKKVAVVEYDKVYLPNIYYPRKKTLSYLSSENAESDTDCYRNEDINQLLRKRFTILTGAAGTGKTTILKQIAKLYKGSVAITALTGKAASLFGDDAMTLHRLLGYGYKGFSVKELHYDLIIVDEASMLDWYTTYALYRAARGRVILSGDKNQLPPVKGGSVLTELLDVLPVVTLEKVHRFVGGKVNIVRYRRETMQQLIGSIINLSKRLIENGIDFQVITPVKGDMVGTFKLNDILQKYLNPNGRVVLNNLRIGDRVIVTKNCYRKEIPAYNGQVGTIVSKDEERRGSIYVALDNGNTLPFYGDEIDLAYALTVHKVQGSQFDRVIFVDPQGKYEDFIDEKMTYTAESRGKEKTYVFTI